jgi:hypothetical protein
LPSSSTTTLKTAGIVGQLKLYEFVLVDDATNVVEGGSSDLKLVTSDSIPVVLEVVPVTTLLIGGTPVDSAGDSVLDVINTSLELGSNVVDSPRLAVDVAGCPIKVLDSPMISVVAVVGSAVELGTISVVVGGSPIEVLVPGTTSVVAGGSSTDVL